MIGESKLIVARKRLRDALLRLRVRGNSKNSEMSTGGLIRESERADLEVLTALEGLTANMPEIVEYLDQLEGHYKEAKKTIERMRQDAVMSIPAWVASEIHEQSSANESMSSKIKHQRKELRRLNRKVSDLLHGMREKKKGPPECPHCNVGKVKLYVNVREMKSQGYCPICHKRGAIAGEPGEAMARFMLMETSPVDLSGEGRHG